jgi:hypothetical protein
MNFRRCTDTVVFVLLLLTGGYAQERSATKDSFPPTLWRLCDSQNRAKRVFTSPVLVSVTGGHSAKVKVESVHQQGLCFDTTVLWIAGAASSATNAGAAFIRRPKSAYNSGNGMNLMDWSPDGRLLLAEFWEWNAQPNDEGIDKRILLFKEDGTRKLEIDTERFWSDQKGKNCHLEFRLLGFTPSGRVAIQTDITPYYEPGQESSDVPPSRTCLPQHQAWAVDPHTQRREPLSSGFRAARYSVVKGGDTASTP